MTTGFWAFIVVGGLIAMLMAWCLARMESIQEAERRRRAPRADPQVWNASDGRWIGLARGRQR